MQRAMISLLALGTLANGCIIYETEHIRDRKCIDCEDTDFGDTDDGWVAPTGDDDDDDSANGTEPQAPVYDFDLTITVGAPGEVLLTWLEEGSGDFDYTNIAEITFVGDITVLDTVIRPDEAMLLLEIDADATPGTVQVFVEFVDDTAILLETPFTIEEPAPGCTANGGGDTGTEDPCP